jgi:hypothetical protein
MFATLAGMVGILVAPLLTQAEQIHVLHLKGKAVGETRPIPEVETTGTHEGNCFDVEMLDPQSSNRIGTATRCFTDIKTFQEGMAATETTFLKFRDGMIVARNHVTIQPLLEDSAEMTHIIGAVPAPLATNLLPEHSTNHYQGRPGSLRHGGVVDLSRFQEKNEITFDDIAMVTFPDIQAQIKEAQRSLDEAGFYTGTIDGILGPKTRDALYAYQAKHGLPRTGELDDPTRKALGLQ